MTLYDWMVQEGVTGHELTLQLGVSPGTIARWIKGNEPMPKYLRRVIRRTKGQVTREDFTIHGGRLADGVGAAARAPKSVGLGALLRPVSPSPA